MGHHKSSLQLRTTGINNNKSTGTPSYRPIWMFQWIHCKEEYSGLYLNRDLLLPHLKTFRSCLLECVDVSICSFSNRNSSTTTRDSGCLLVSLWMDDNSKHFRRELSMWNAVQDTETFCIRWIRSGCPLPCHCHLMCVFPWFSWREIVGWMQEEKMC